jgi:polar amino acid transport system permease protein
MSPPFDLLPHLLRGLGVTLQITAMGTLLAFTVAFVAGIARSSKNRIISGITGLYVEFFRGTSALVQMFWIFFVLPLPPFNITLTPMQAGVIALGLNIGAYGSEVVRGAIAAVSKGQVEAGIALNFSPRQRLVRIIVPQAMVRILPPFGNLLIELLKSTALVSLITLSDLTFEAMKTQQTIGRSTEVFTLLLIIYFIIALPLTRAVRYLESRRVWA